MARQPRHCGERALHVHHQGELTTLNLSAEVGDKLVPHLDQPVPGVAPVSHPLRSVIGYQSGRACVRRCLSVIFDSL